MGIRLLCLYDSNSLVERMADMIAICQLLLWELLIPLIVGTLFLNMDTGRGKLPFMWISGQFLLWAVFQALCVPFVLLQIDFYIYVWFYAAAVGILLVMAFVLRGRTMKAIVSETRLRKEKRDIARVYWLIFAGLLVFQLVMAVFMTYADGDDAYYVAVTTVTNDAETMYEKLPYTGGATELDVRHGLAPLPIWIAFLAKASGVESATAAHIAVPLMLITMTYGIFYLIGTKVFSKGDKGKLPLFLIFTELLVLFGDYSYYTAENFMIARSRQGKAALGNIVIPMLFLLVFLLMEYWQENKKVKPSFWVLLVCTIMTGCMCSTMGALLCCMFIGVAGLCGAVAYRKWKFLIPLGLSCAPCVLYALLYLMQN